MENFREQLGKLDEQASAMIEVLEDNQEVLDNTDHLYGLLEDLQECITDLQIGYGFIPVPMNESTHDINSN